MSHCASPPLAAGRPTNRSRRRGGALGKALGGGAVDLARIARIGRTLRRPAEGAMIERTAEDFGRTGDDFVVLERSLPVLKGGGGASGWTSPSDGLSMASRVAAASLVSSTWSRIPSIAKMLLVLPLATAAVALPAIYGRVRGGATFAEYPLTVVVGGGAIEVAFWMEVARWTVLAELVTLALVVTQYSSVFVPQLISVLSRHGRTLMPASMMAVLEVTSVTWPFFACAFFATALSITARTILPYASPITDAARGRLPPSVILSGLSVNFFVERSIFILCIFAYLVLLEKILLHSITNAFNRSLYRDRITRYLFALWTIEVLRKAASTFNYLHISHHRANFGRLWRPRPYAFASGDSLTSFVLEHFVRLGKKSASKKPILARRLFRFLVQNPLSQTEPAAASLLPRTAPHPAKGWRRAVDRVRLERTPKEAHLGGAPCEEAGEEAGEEAAPEAFLTLADLAPFFQSHDVRRAFEVFNTCHEANVSEDEFVKTIDAIYLERSTLVKVILTNSDVIRKLDKVMMAVLIAAIAILFPVIVGFNPTEALIPLSSTWGPSLLLFSLALKDMVTTYVSSLFFIFVTHPYDVGDRVYLARGNYFVRKMSILTTMFERWDGFTVYYPNCILAQMAICNVRRTRQQTLRVELILPAASTTADTLAAIERRVAALVVSESRDFAAIRTSQCLIRELNEFVLLFTVRHRESFYDGTLMSQRNNKFMGHLATIITDLHIEYFTKVQTVDFDPALEGEEDLYTRRSAALFV